MKNILPIPNNTEITVIDVLYYEQYKHKNTYDKDVIFIVYRVGDNGEKKVHRIVEPEIEYYLAKPETRTYRTPREYVPMEDVYPVVVKAKNVRRDIIDKLKDDDSEVGKKFKKVINLCFETKNYRAMNEIHKYPYVFMSDLTPENYYRIFTSFNYNTEHAHVFRKSYMDIETDIFGLSDYDTKRNRDKVNAITIIFDHDPSKKTDKNCVYTFLLRDHERYPQQVEFEKNLKEFNKRCHEEFDEVEIIRDGKKVHMKTNAKYHIVFCDSEKELHEKFWQLANAANPDTMAIWNIGFDIPKVYNRMTECGLNPVDVMSHPAFPKPVRFVEMRIDQRPNINHSDRKTFIKMTGMIKMIDQMLTYAAANKGLKDYGSNELDNIANVELGWSKRNFTDPTVSIRNAAIKSYLEFVLYSIQDVWVQFFIDKVTQHSDTIMMDSNASACGLENIYKQTQYLRNLYYLYRLNRGYVSANNVNNDYISGMTDEYLEELNAMREYAMSKALQSDDDDDDTPEAEHMFEDASVIDAIIDNNLKNMVDGVNIKHRLQGGLVGNPNNNSNNGEELIKGIKSKHVFLHCMDQDYGSEYPNAKISRNISKSTQAWRIVINKKISDRQNPHGNEKYIPGGEYLSDYISKDFISMGNVWHNLPTVAECLERFNEFND